MPQLLHLVFGGELVDPAAHRVPRRRRHRRRRHLPELRHRLRRLEGQGAGDRGQRPHPLLHRPPAPAARRGAGGAARPRSWARRAGPPPTPAMPSRGRAPSCSASTSPARGAAAASRGACSSGGAPRARRTRARLGERMGEAGLPRPEGQLVWFHAASVGEAASLLEMLRRLTQARPSADLPRHHRHGDLGAVPRRPAAGELHPPVRAARRAALGRALPRPLAPRRRGLDRERALAGDALRDPRPRHPDAADQRPHLDAELPPLADDAAARARRCSARFDRILAQDALAGEQLTALGADPERLSVEGSLKEGAAPLPYDEAERVRIARAFAGRPVWLAASTHPGEEEMVARRPRPRPPRRCRCWR